MTVDANALFLNIDNVYTAANLGIMARDLFSEGRIASGLQVTQRGAGANMSVDVSAGVGYVAGDDNTNTQPIYRVYNDGTVNLTITGADPSNPRWDIVILEVLDSVFSGVSNLARLRVVAGTPAASPAEPTLPNNALKLARVVVDAAATSITTAKITDKATTAQVGGGSAHVMPIVTALPTNPYDGQLVRYAADATNGVYWLLQYRSASASSYKWEFLGGPPLFAEVATLETTTSTSYTDLATAGPTVTTPLEGDFDVEFGSHSSGTIATAVQKIAVKRGASATSDNDAIVQQPPGNNYQSAGQTQRLRRMTGLSSSTALKLQYVTNNGTASFERRWISLKPVRVI